ncbi:mandelate racemase/muconate lactonizing enzyme family protein [Halobium salinum]|uniref:Mandelate racemase/muconate lactonizing enzyme family protein n=1 Tax=Halobium salinum TaxID=1364940 RepID=A0ABD5PHW2_9EURY|nr:mandelate racemase/muconate lactonizing enzyme family protein [Halobium salinum]
MQDVSIENVEAVGVEAPVEEPFGYAQAWVETRSAVLVRIEADDGTVGWGECWGPVAGTRETVASLLGPALVGESPLDVERLHRDLYDRARAAYQSTVPLPALSGLDLALWDLKGTLLGVPVATLLGGRERDAVDAYATGHYFRPTDDLEEQYASICDEATANADAFGRVKLKVGLALLGHGPDEDLELVRRVRDRVGPDVDLMVDANYAYDRPTARRIGRELGALDVCWFEEPVRPTDHDGYERLSRTLDVPVAGGECHGPAALDRLLSRGALDIVQPDVCNVGGLTPAREVADGTRRAGVPLVPHVWGTPVALAASLQLLATLPGDPPLEFDRSANPLREELATDPIEADDEGRVTVPEGPGLGVELEPDAVERYRVDG